VTDKGRLMDAAAIATDGALVYVLDCDHAVKIGITVQAVEQRVDELARGSGLTSIQIVRTWPFSQRSAALAIERAAHYLLRETRTVGEWFHCHPLEACTVVERLIAHGIPFEAQFGAEAGAALRTRLAETDAA
jgi:Meiotically up-regulated gene 113